MKFVAAALRAQTATAMGREDWIEMQLIHIFMRHARPSLHAAAILVALMAATLYRSADPLELGLWTSAAAAVTLLRLRVIRLYYRDLRDVGGAPLQIFMGRHAWLWWATAVVWGLLMQVFFLKAPLYDQFLCMLVLAGMAGFSVGTFSSCMRCFTAYVDSLGLTVLAVLVWQLALQRGLPSDVNTWGLVFLVLLYWAVIRMAGRRFHQMQRSNLELQFDNALLIRSLTDKTRAAEDAVGITNRFIASAAHDLRQPVHALDLYATWLAAEPQYVTQIAPKISRSTRAITELFNSLFDLAGLTAEPVRVNWQDVDVAALMHELDQHYAPLAAEKGIRLKIRPASLIVRSDPVLLKRLAGNLLSNAIRNTPKGGVLLILRQRQASLCLEVWDTGVGIAREHRSSVFKEFYRVPLQGTEEGFGLGLAIVSRLSEALGHPVTMSSRLGRGSVFRVELAAARRGPQA